jgi:hypothetical protein
MSWQVLNNETSSSVVTYFSVLGQFIFRVVNFNWLVALFIPAEAAPAVESGTFSSDNSGLERFRILIKNKTRKKEVRHCQP